MTKHKNVPATVAPVDTSMLDIDVATLMPPVDAPEGDTPEVAPEVQPDAPAPEVEETEEAKVERIKFEQDAELRALALADAKAKMVELGTTCASGTDALTNAGIYVTQCVWDNTGINESHCEELYRDFAIAFNGKAKGGERKEAVDKSAISRFKTFFKRPVADFVYGQKGINHNWHDLVADIREDITPKMRAGSLYNALVTFNREVVNAKKAAPSVVTVEHMTKLLTRKAVDPKTVEARLLALVKAATTTMNVTGAPNFDNAVIKVLSDYIDGLDSDFKKQLIEAE